MTHFMCAVFYILPLHYPYRSQETFYSWVGGFCINIITVVACCALVFFTPAKWRWEVNTIISQLHRQTQGPYSPQEKNTEL